MVAFRTSYPLASARESSRPVFGGTGLAVAAAERYADEITVGTPGKCPKRPVLLICLYDNSGSITGGNDPIGQRFLEASIAIQRVGSRCRCGRDLVATVHFDTPTSGDLHPTPIVKGNREAIERSLAIPPDGAGISCIGPSLATARRIAAQHPSHRVVVVALTDWELFDEPDCLQDFIDFPGDAHAVVLRSAPPTELLVAPNVTVTPVNYASRPGVVARAVFAALTKTRPGARALAATDLNPQSQLAPPSPLAS